MRCYTLLTDIKCALAKTKAYIFKLQQNRNISFSQSENSYAIVTLSNSAVD